MQAVRLLVLVAFIVAVAAFEYCGFKMGTEINQVEGKGRRFPLYVLFGLFPLLIRHGKLVPTSRTRLLFIFLIPVIFVLPVFLMMLRS